MCYPIDSNTFIEDPRFRGQGAYVHVDNPDLDSCQCLKITWFWDLTTGISIYICMEGSGMYTVDGISLALFFHLNTLPSGSRFHHS
jgi:hypothetical protein